MHMRVVTIGAETHKTQYNFENELAEMHFAIAVESNYWDSVTLSMWVEGAGNWHTVKEFKRVGDWHNAPRTHSYA
jgi:hypothetical protein